jgi:predicted nucleic acid-binding protein
MPETRQKAAETGTFDVAALLSTVQSDWLPRLHRLATQFPELAELIEDYLRLNIVIDANYVQQELQWRVKRRKPDARTKLHESASSGVIVLFAPTHLIREIEDDLHEIAERVGCSVERVREEWSSFRQHLHFYTPRNHQLRSSIAVVDADDLPYIAACEDLGAHAVYSRDRHLRQMKAPVISVAIDGTLQSYARATSVRLALMVGSAFSLRLSVRAMEVVAGAVVKLYHGFRRLPVVVQIGVIAALVYVFLDKKLRRGMLNFLKGLGRAASPLLDALAAAAEQMQIAQVTLDSAKERMLGVLPRRQRIPVIARARRICLLSKTPVSLAELEKRVIADGHSTSSAQFHLYLRRVLRSSGEFAESQAGWRLTVSEADID